MPKFNGPRLALLFSGGLDSAILLQQLLAEGCRVQPLYVACGMRWEQVELAAARRYLEALGHDALEPLVVLSSPLAALYPSHWSVPGEGARLPQIPAYDSEDSAVYLPGRNLMLAGPAGLWCQLRGIEQLAIGTLAGHLFHDAAPAFFSQLEALLRQCHAAPLALRQPLLHADKAALMAGGRELPLELTFSCLAPVEEIHCGKCNKCAERQRAFSSAAIPDATPYAIAAVSS